MDMKELIQAIEKELDAKNPYPGGIDEGGICKGCGVWSPFRHPKGHQHKEDCSLMVAMRRHSDLKGRIRDVLQKAKYCSQMIEGMKDREHNSTW